MSSMQSASKGEIRSLTGLRGVAASFVVLYHYFQVVINGGHLGIFIHHGYLSVDLFFVLSGFVMMLSYERRFRGSFNARSYADFLYKRFGRIYPLYAVITIVFVAALYFGMVPGSGPASIRDIALNLLLIHGWGTAQSIAGPTWSISTEFAAYLLFPVFVYVTGGAATKSIVLALVSLALLLAVGSLSTQQVNEISDGVSGRNGPLDVFSTDTPYPLLRCLAGFALGVVSYRLSQVGWMGWTKQIPYSGDAIMAAVLVCLLMHGTDVLIVLLFVPLVICMADGKSVTRWALGTPFVFWLGTVSYSIYLVHMLVNSVCRARLTDLLEGLHVPHGYTIGGILLLAPMVAISAATYYGIERPARDGLRSLARKPVTPIANEPSAP